MFPPNLNILTINCSPFVGGCFEVLDAFRFSLNTRTHSHSATKKNETSEEIYGEKNVVTTLFFIRRLNERYVQLTKGLPHAYFFPPSYNNYSLCNSILLLPCVMVYYIVSVLFLLFFWCPCMAINVSVQYDGWLLPDIIILLSTQCYFHRGTRLNAMKRLCTCSL